jgi:catechol 2,3-dioxygenase
MIGIERIGHAVLRVSDVETAVAFYRDVLGMEAVRHDPSNAAFMSFGTLHHDIGLFKDKGGGTRGSLGLAHLALRLPGGDPELRDAYAKLKAAGVEVDHATDHGMTHSVYFHDPDGNTLEIYVDVYSEEEGMEVMRNKGGYRQALDLETVPAG